MTESEGDHMGYTNTPYKEADTVNVDTLVETLEAWRPDSSNPLPDQVEFDAALSDLAARARDNSDFWRSAMQAEISLAEERAEAAEADRDRLQAEVDFLLSDPDMQQIGEWIEQRESRLARRVAELEQERDKLQGRVYAMETTLPDGYLAELESADRRVAELKAVLREIDRDYHCIVAEPDPDAGQHLDGCVGCFARAALAGDGGGACPRGIDPTHGDDLRRAGLLPDGGGARQVKADPAVFGESNRLLGGDGGGA